MQTIITSEKWQIIKLEFKKLIKGALICTVGATLAYLQSYFGAMDFNEVANFFHVNSQIVLLALTIINSLLTNALIKFTSRTNYVINR